MDRRPDRDLDLDSRAVRAVTDAPICGAVTTAPICRAVYLGRVGYRAAEALQRDLVARRRRGEIDDAMLFLEHPPVITIGRSGDGRHLLASAAELARRGIDLVECRRGGDITYHGPGQLVIYPILQLRSHERDLHAYLRALERAVIAALGELGVRAGRREGLTGVWVEEAKIASIGIRVENWVSSHGVALNAANDLSPFALMPPCGLRNGKVTSVSEVTGRAARLDELVPLLARAMGDALGRRIRWPGGGI
jgi:lipoyl(octanoyl) transferase